MSAPFVTGAGAAPRRTAQVTPPQDLGDQVARVTWQGFRPTREDRTYGVTVMQCGLHPKSVVRDCNFAEAFPKSLTGNQAQGVTQADGTGDVFIDVESTARFPALACSHTHPCSLLVFENGPDGFDPEHLPADFVLVRLDFRQNAADCPPPARFDVRLETETSAAAALYRWAAALCSEPHPFALDVTNTSSTAARREFFEQHVDVGVSSVPPQVNEVTGTSPAYAVAPVDLTAIVVAYNIVDPVTQHRITDVTLTPRLVARLVSDSDVLTLFEDPEFKKLNPRHHFPLATAEPLVRAEQNADTWLVTNWLGADPGARKLLDGKDTFGIPVNPAWEGVHYPTDVFEARNPAGAYLPRTGEEDVAERVFHSTKPVEGVSTNPADYGFFAVLDLPIARRFDLPVAKLTAGVGRPIVALDDASIEAGYKAMTTTRDGFHVEPGAPADPKAWPLTKVDHALVPTATSDPTKAAALHRLLQYAAGPGQKSLPDGFVPLPSRLSEQTLRTAAALVPPPTTATVPSTFVPVSTFDTSSVSSNSSATSGSTNASATPAPPASRPIKVAVKDVPRAKPVLAISPAGPERFAFPIVLLVGLLAFAFGAADLTRRKVTGARK